MDETGKDLSDSQKALGVALAVIIARHLHRLLPSYDFDDGKYLHHWYMSAFEDGCSALWYLDVARAGYLKDKIFDLSVPVWQQRRAELPQVFPPYFRILDPEAVRTRLSSAWPAPATSIDDLICAFLVLAEHAEGAAFSFRKNRPATPPNEEYAEAFLRLSEAGYLRRESSGFFWSDKIAPHMLSGFFWNEEDHDPSGIRPEVIAEEAARVRQSFAEPANAACVRFVRLPGLAQRALALMTRWTGSAWVEPRLDTVFHSFDEAMALALLFEGHPDSERYGAAELMRDRERAWTTLRADIRNDIAERGDIISLVKLLADHWDRGEWNLNEAKRRFQLSEVKPVAEVLRDTHFKR